MSFQGPGYNPVDDNAEGEQSVTETGKKHGKDMTDTQDNIIVRKVKKEYNNLQVTKAEEAIKDN